MKKVLEKDIQREVCEYLEKKGAFFWRNNNIPVYDTKRGAYRAMPKFSMLGVPDILVVTDGGFMVFLEIKTPTGVQSTHQKEFQRRCKEIGAEYYLVKDVSELEVLGL